MEKCINHRQRIQTRAIMMQHSFNPWNSTRVEKIPVATCIAVVAPVRESRRVAADAGESFGCEGGGVEVSVVCV